jgi:PIN domain nuclease of toxin-antitoxin system
MAIKQSKNKLTLALPLEDYIQQKLKLEDFELLPISLNHLAIISSLPFHHNDPFDRLIIAQAIAEGIPTQSLDLWYRQTEQKKLTQGMSSFTRETN